MSYNPLFDGSSGSSVGGDLTNNSGSMIGRVTPVRVDSNGEMQLVDVSVEEQSVSIVGVTFTDIANTKKGTIVSSGRVQNVATTANFGDTLFVSKTGGLTNIKPSIGVGSFVAGDFVIKIGVLFKNETNPLQQDLMLCIDVVGQL